MKEKLTKAEERNKSLVAWCFVLEADCEKFFKKIEKLHKDLVEEKEIHKKDKDILMSTNS